MTRGRTRLAPTPSGYLHLGNVLHFLVVEHWAKELALDVHLRIDDFDTARVQERYVADIFRVLEELDITWHSGPRSAQDVTPMLTRDAAWRELARARERGLSVYACRCSRTSIAAGAQCGCRAMELPFEPGETSLRCDLGRERLLNPDPGVVLWRRDDLPAYHLASVVVDRQSEITHIMRGSDLLPATRIQQAIAPYFDAMNVANATVHHHPLLVDTRGQKISKSAGASATPMRIPPLEDLRAHARALLAGDGGTVPSGDDLEP